MPAQDRDREEQQRSATDPYPTTRWSLVLAAGRDEDPEARAALATLCETYWQPLYAYVRRRASSEEDARDLLQGFFTRFLERRDVAAADPLRGRFRAYLLTALKHDLANAWDKERALKRGGGKAPLPLDFADAERRLRGRVDDAETPEHLYQRQWVGTLLGRVLETLRQESVEQGKGELFDELKAYLSGTAERGDYARAGEHLGMSEGALRTAAQRLRERYRELLRLEIAQTVRDPADIDDEIAELFAAVRAPPRIHPESP